MSKSGQVSPSVQLRPDARVGLLGLVVLVVHSGCAKPLVSDMICFYDVVLFFVFVIQISWTKDGGCLPPHVELYNEEDEAGIFIGVSQMSDAGLYTCTLQNDKGNKEYSVKIIVCGKLIFI